MLETIAMGILIFGAAFGLLIILACMIVGSRQDENSGDDGASFIVDAGADCTPCDSGHCDSGGCDAGGH